MPAAYALDAALVERQDQPLELSDFQKRVLAIPESLNIFLGGGRGGAKSHAMLFLALRYAATYREYARILYLRKTYAGLNDFENLTRDLFGRIYGKAARYNQNEGIWRLPTGSTFELGQLETIGDYAKYQGRSFGLICVDELGQYGVPDLIDKLRSNMRGPVNVPLRMILSSNPGDIGHSWIAARYVFKRRPWEPFTEPMSGAQFVYSPSTYKDNPFIDQKAYLAQLLASAPADPELVRAWVEGDWSISRGSFFGLVLSEQRNCIDPWTLPLKLSKDRTPAGPAHRGIFLKGSPDPWEFFLGFDFGVGAPAYCGIFAESPGARGPDGRRYPCGSILLLDEVHTAASGQLNVGLGLTVPRLSEWIKDRCKEWKIRPRGVADDAIFARSGGLNVSIADEFRKEGVLFVPAKKADRVSGWEVLRRLMQNAGDPSLPGFYAARSCEYFWATVPYLSRDMRKLNDVSTTGPDHAADAVRYACLRRRVAEEFCQKEFRV